jgi:peptidoglycan hydrolase-like amidase
MSQTYSEAWERNYTPGSKPAGVYDAEKAPAQFTGNLPFSPGDLLKFLTVAPEVFCNSRFTGVQCFRWLKIFSYAELAPLLQKRYRVGALKSIAITERSASGYVRRIKIVGDDRSITVSGDFIRSALGGLRSNLFMLLPIRQTHSEQAAPAAWMIWGGGWGHGVGLCQSGAAEMAEQGHTAEEILRHYYPQTELGPHAR